MAATDARARWESSTTGRRERRRFRRARARVRLTSRRVRGPKRRERPVAVGAIAIADEAPGRSIERSSCVSKYRLRLYRADRTPANWARGDGARSSFARRAWVRVARGRTLATTVRCALMPEDILEDSLACGDGSGGKGRRSRGRRPTARAAKSRITRAAARRDARRCERRLDARRPRDAAPTVPKTPWRPSHAPGMAQWPRRRRAGRARRTRRENATLAPLRERKVGVRRARARARCERRRSVARARGGCRGLVRTGATALMDIIAAMLLMGCVRNGEQLARAGALKSQSGRSKRGATRTRGP